MPQEISTELAGGLHRVIGLDVDVARFDDVVDNPAELCGFIRFGNHAWKTKIYGSCLQA